MFGRAPGEVPGTVLASGDGLRVGSRSSVLGRAAAPPSPPLMVLSSGCAPGLSMATVGTSAEEGGFAAVSETGGPGAPHWGHGEVDRPTEEPVVCQRWPWGQLQRRAMRFLP